MKPIKIIRFEIHNAKHAN